MTVGGRQLMEMEPRPLFMVLAVVCIESSDLMTALSSSDSDWDDHLEASEPRASNLAFTIGYKEGEDTAAVPMPGSQASTSLTTMRHINSFASESTSSRSWWTRCAFQTSSRPMVPSTASWRLHDWTWEATHGVNGLTWRLRGPVGGRKGEMLASVLVR